MKNHFTQFILFAVMFALVLALTSCAGTPDTDSLWKNSLYQTDTSFGSGSVTVSVVVKAGEKSVTFTLNTDKDTLGEALMEYGLIDGDMGEYGLYLKKANGITADYDADGAYWSFNDENGNMMPVGVDGAKINNGEKYELVYTK